MGYKRVQVKDEGFISGARAGAGWLTAIQRPSVVNSDSFQLIPVSAMQGGLYIRMSTIPVTDGFETAANMIAGLKGMDVGDTLVFRIVNQSNSSLTLVSNTGISGISPNILVGALSNRTILVEKTSSTTMAVTDLI